MRVFSIDLPCDLAEITEREKFAPARVATTVLDLRQELVLQSIVFLLYLSHGLLVVCCL